MPHVSAINIVWQTLLIRFYRMFMVQIHHHRPRRWLDLRSRLQAYANQIDQHCGSCPVSFKLSIEVTVYFKTNKYAQPTYNWMRKQPSNFCNTVVTFYFFWTTDVSVKHALTFRSTIIRMLSANCVPRTRWCGPILTSWWGMRSISGSQ
jgi:hypothetical protein